MARNRKHQHRTHVTTTGFRPTANPAAAQAARERARSNAAGYHAATPNRQRTRAARNRAAIRDASY